MSKRHIFIFLIFSNLFSAFSNNVIVISRSSIFHPLNESITRILTEAYSRIGYSIEFKHYPLQRSIVMANNGVVDGELFRGEFDQTKYPNLLKVPVPLGIGELSVFTKLLSFDVDGWESISPYKVAIRIGLKPAEKGTQGMNVIRVNDEVELFKVLNSERVDLVIAPKDVGERQIQKQGFYDVRCLTPPIKRDFLYHYLHRDNKELIPKLTEVLNSMQDEGFFNKLEL